MAEGIGAKREHERTTANQPEDSVAGKIFCHYLTACCKVSKYLDTYFGWMFPDGPEESKDVGSDLYEQGD